MNYEMRMCVLFLSMKLICGLKCGFETLEIFVKKRKSARGLEKHHESHYFNNKNKNCST